MEIHDSERSSRGVRRKSRDYRAVLPDRVSATFDSIIGI